MRLKDIAEQVGVSVSTVSRVLTDQETKSASDEIKRKTWEIVRETNYTPNENAKQLRKKSSKEQSKKEMRYYALINVRNAEGLQDPFFSEVTKAIEYEAYKYNYILRCVFYVDDLHGQDIKQILKKNEISGTIVIGRTENSRIRTTLESLNNVVFVSLAPTPHKHDAVFCDGVKAGAAAVDYLVSLGHREIAYIGEVGDGSRYSGYCKAMEAHNLPVDNRWVVKVLQSMSSGYEAATKLIERETGVTAILCADDSTAIGTLKALKEHKIPVPKRISVIGISDIEMSRYVSPMLTTVHTNIPELGSEAVRRLVYCAEHRQTLPIRLELPFSLSIRESCSEVYR